MSLLFKHLRIHQVFGANTDVGKTILTSALARASAQQGTVVHYLKPVSTGPPQDADDYHILQFGGPSKKLIKPHCLYRYQEPVSPHLAATLAQNGSEDMPPAPSDETFLRSVATYIRQCASSKMAHMYVETAGGVHSPTLSGTTQLDAYRPLFLPTILVGDSRLGGISSTISAYDSLLLRGYIVDAILLFQDSYYKNSDYLTPYFAERGVFVSAVNAPPPRLLNVDENFQNTEAYYESIAPLDGTGSIHDIVQHLSARHVKRLDDLNTLPKRTLDTVWWPFVQHGLVRGPEDVTAIDSAHGDFFSVYKASSPSHPSTTTRSDRFQDEHRQPLSLLEPQFDGSASWWTQTFGHAHPRLTLAAARAAGRYGHVMFPQSAHAPALSLAERLVHGPTGQGWASRAFISDNGSTGMEVALKMALRAFCVRETELGRPVEEQGKKGLGVLGLKGSYHGDTIGAMDACSAGEGVYTCEWHDARGFWFDPPSVAFRSGKVVVSLPPALATPGKPAEEEFESLQSVYDVSARLDTPLAVSYRSYVTRTLAAVREEAGAPLAALVLEPLVLGAGGMIFVDPLFQRVLVDTVRSSSSMCTGSGGDWEGMPVIFDEVFAGLFRLGHARASSVLGIHPDISVHAKTLTGGLVPLAVTLASDSIFRAFVDGESKAKALLHGHSYTAHAVGCEVANEALEMMEEVSKSEGWQEAREKWEITAVDGEDRGPGVWSLWDPGFVKVLSEQEKVDEVMTLGSVLAIKTADGGGYRSMAAQELLKSLKDATYDDSTLSSAPGGAPFAIHFRTLGNVAYFMLSLNTSTATVRTVEDRIWNVLNRA